MYALRRILIVWTLLCALRSSSGVFFDDLFGLPGKQNDKSLTLTGSQLEQLFKSCYSCHGTTISAVTSSCWEVVDETHTRFVSQTPCLGLCSTTVLNHTTIGLVEFTRRCEPDCNATCYHTDQNTHLCKYCCNGDKCNDILPNYVPEKHETLNHVSNRNLRKWITGVLAKPRHHAADPSNKVAARKFIAKMLLDFGIVSELNNFKIWQVHQEDRAPINFQSYIKTVVRGYNIIATIRGVHYGKMQDRIIVIMAHYDTNTDGTPGVNDNGSGVSALLEIARLLTRNESCTRNYSVVLAATDFKEEGHFADGLSGSGYTNCYVGEQFNGLAGSAHFLCGWLLPHLRRTGSRLQLAVNLDTLLNYDTSSSSQSMPNFHQLLSTNSNAEINRVLRKYENQISRRKFAGDWVLASYIDMETEFNRVSFYADQLEEMWNNIEISNTQAGFISQRLSPQGRQLAQHDDCLVFRRLRNPLPCISLTDTGALRGYMRRCHNAMCDDKSHVTDENIEFLSQITDTVWRVVENLSEGNCGIKSNDEEAASTTAAPEVWTTNPVETCDQPILEGSAGNAINTTTTITATCRITSLSLELCDTQISGPWAYLNGKSAWRPKKGRKSSNRQHWLKVDLGRTFNVTGISVQGAPGFGYIRSFMISFSDNNRDWWWHDPSNPEWGEGRRRTEIRGNSNGRLAVKRVISPTVVSRYIRIHPQRWGRRIALRLEVYGCLS